MGKGKYLLIVPGRFSPIPVDSFAAASAAYAERRDESGEGASTFPDGLINDYGVNVARLSYNAKVWSMDEWKAGMQPLFDPYTQKAA